MNSMKAIGPRVVSAIQAGNKGIWLPVLRAPGLTTLLQNAGPMFVWEQMHGFGGWLAGDTHGRRASLDGSHLPQCQLPKAGTTGSTAGCKSGVRFEDIDTVHTYSPHHATLNVNHQTGDAQNTEGILGQEWGTSLPSGFQLPPVPDVSDKPEADVNLTL